MKRRTFGTSPTYPSKTRFKGIYTAISSRYTKTAADVTSETYNRAIHSKKSCFSARRSAASIVASFEDISKRNHQEGWTLTGYMD